ncbi:MAG: toll/interleukin-1 receptor domain-containing protein [Rhodocyclaceae bacterium]
MPIKQRDLRAAATRVSRVVVAKSLREARAAKQQTAFLCHSHLDVGLVRGIQNFLKEQGWDLYIDWLDEELPSAPDKETAEKIKNKIVETDWFLFLATANSTKSRWCPWELGYADAKKRYEHIVIIQTEDDDGKYHGNEYLQLYRKLTDATSKIRSGYAVFAANSTNGGVWIDELMP